MVGTEEMKYIRILAKSHKSLQRNQKMESLLLVTVERELL